MRILSSFLSDWLTSLHRFQKCLDFMSLQAMTCSCGSNFVTCLHYACFPKTVRLLTSYWELTMQFTNMMKTTSHSGKSYTMSSEQTCICLTPQSTQNVCLRKRSCNWLLSPRLCTKIKKYLSLQLNTTVGSLIWPSCSQSMGRNPHKGGEGSKNGSHRGDPNRSCVFSTLPLVVCVCL